MESVRKTERGRERKKLRPEEDRRGNNEKHLNDVSRRNRTHEVRRLKPREEQMSDDFRKSEKRDLMG